MSLNHTQRRVVITGMGVIAPNGSSLETFWESICEGNSAARRLTRFDPGDMPNKICAEIQDFDGGVYMKAKKSHRLDLSTQYGIAASILAVRDAAVDFEKLDQERLGVVEGISLGGTETTIKGQESLTKKSYRAINAFSLINGYTGSGSGEIALELGIRGHAITYCSGSASSNDAIGYAFNMIQQDEVDIMVAGGTEAPMLPALWAVFCVTGVMTCRNDKPQQAMRPFDRNRDGFLLGEGAAFLVLEELSHAIARGAKIYAEVAGHGRSCEAYHSVAPHPDGVGTYRAMEKALRRARMDVSEIDYINAHGTATESNDLVETKAIKHLFGDHARRLAVSSTKPVTGHLLGAAGAIETVICALALKHQEIPPTINLTEPAEGCDLDYVLKRSRPYPIRAAMNLNSGFGGKNSCLILRAFPARA
ncbi:MAG: beta-ketoacyl-[acyl-carrier-protein] synthase family protein [Verrucomicrobia bacterium]|nr:beta-ketoacyl-[acyl-carrier-protein] synthase family protein [Verrucomicrobiota bacterium]